MCNRLVNGVFLLMAILLIGLYVFQWNLLSGVKELFWLPLS